MIVLGLDTATFTASAALVDAEGAVLAEGTLDTSGRGDDLLVLLDELCRTANLSPRQLGAVAVGAGPGSFTGLRIGMATAKGIAFAAKSPLWLVSSLAAMAAELAAAERERAAATSAGALWVPVLDARRGEVFAGFYRSGQNGELIEAAAEAVLAPEELVRRLATTGAPEISTTATTSIEAVCAGDAIEVFAEPLAALAPRWRSKIARTPSAAWIARLALRGERHDSLRSGRPAYLRPAEAEIMYPDGVPGALRTLALPSTTRPVEKA
jgi:tRNA threonylcarbamoyladenosine biosynthesis protein TsaB